MATFEQLTALIQSAVGAPIMEQQRKIMEVVSEVAALSEKIKVIQETIEKRNTEHSKILKVDNKFMKLIDYVGDKSEVHFSEWAFKFIVYVSANNRLISEVLEWAMKEKKPITGEALKEKAEELNIIDIESLNHYIYTSIASCFSGDATTFLRTLDREEPSAEIWRKINQRFDPDTAKSQTMGIKGLLNNPERKPPQTSWLRSKSGNRKPAITK